MESAARQMNVPSEVIKILASHGAVRVSIPGFEGGGQAVMAPFEDVLHLFVSPSSPILEALLRSTRMEVAAKGADNAYQVRMTGRSHAGRPMAGHPRTRPPIAGWGFRLFLRRLSTCAGKGR